MKKMILSMILLACPAVYAADLGDAPAEQTGLRARLRSHLNVTRDFVRTSCGATRDFVNTGCDATRNHLNTARNAGARALNTTQEFGVRAINNANDYKGSIGLLGLGVATVLLAREKEGKTNWIIWSSLLCGLCGSTLKTYAIGQDHIKPGVTNLANKCLNRFRRQNNPTEANA